MSERAMCLKCGNVRPLALACDECLSTLGAEVLALRKRVAELEREHLARTLGRPVYLEPCKEPMPDPSGRPWCSRCAWTIGAH